jgi:hypothetical protein
VSEQQQEQVEVSTDLGYNFDATATVPGSPVITAEGVVVDKDVAEALRAEARSIGVRIHFSKVKEGDTE